LVGQLLDFGRVGGGGKQKWQVKCNSFGKTYYGGYYDDIEKAAEQANLLRNAVHGQFAKHC
jgi:hypothetical protein